MDKDVLVAAGILAMVLAGAAWASCLEWSTCRIDHSFFYCTMLVTR